MTFVNSVARIVHEEVTRWGGMCNKNLGNAFLMVWRIGDEASLQNFGGKKRRSSNAGGQSSPIRPIRSLTVDLRRIPGRLNSARMPRCFSRDEFDKLNITPCLLLILDDIVAKKSDLDVISDKALIGFLKVVVEINRDRQVLAYRNDERLRKNSNNFMLRMGFGLHAGWAIEGAVGSLQKVDATYLSPH
eukprot:8046821-Ditylum_brightwellii.AAC.1